MTTHSGKLTSRFRTTGQVINIIVLIICLYVLTEYFFNLQLLRSIFFLGLTLYPLGAVYYLLLSISLILKNNPNGNFNLIANFLSGLVLFWCLLTLIDIIFGLNIHPESFILKDESDRFIQAVKDEFHIENVNLIIPAINLFSLALCIIFIDYQTKSNIRPVQYLCFLNILIVLVQLYAWLYKIVIIIQQISFSILGSMCVYLLTLSILFSRADKGVMRALVGEYSTENIILRILVLVIPLVLGWLKLEGEKLGLYSSEFGTAIFAIIAFLFADALLTRNALLQEKIRKLREESLNKIRESEERLEMILTNIREGVSVANEKGEMIFQNQISKNLFGKDAWKVKEREGGYLKYYSPQGTPVPQFNLPIYKSLKGKIVKNEELLFESSEFPEGITISINSNPIRDEYGKVIESVTVFRDITYRKNVEILYEEDERKFSAILMSIGEGVIIVDPQTNIILFNKKATEILGKHYDESVKIESWPSYFGFYHPDKNELIDYKELTIVKAIREQKNNSAEFYIKNELLRKGKLIEAKSVPVFDEYGKITAAVAVFREIKSGIQA